MQPSRTLLASCSLALAAFLLWAAFGNQAATPATETVAVKLSETPKPQATASEESSAVSATAAPAPEPEVVVRKPLPVSRSTERHEWTQGDCSDPQVLMQIAKHPLEFERLLEEGNRVIARQLVYRKETASARFQHALARGEVVTELLLPDLDGRELRVELTGTEISESALRGTVHGRLVGRPESMVTLAFKGGTEAFTILSPEDNLFIEAYPRVPGEVLVKRIDPAVYVVGRCGSE